ncbi:Methyl-CpG-binding domain protein 4 [Senna tora]|uniref:Methyl-CpG-binding domain protein 4 n=1 Tax=Senna tora TaxID=362788 RepID=A0A834SPS6_9FABA|nr:Methyl-CpG-binding domain protein 4 [Senna tora]
MKSICASPHGSLEDANESEVEFDVGKAKPRKKKKRTEAKKSRDIVNLQGLGGESEVDSISLMGNVGKIEPRGKKKSKKEKHLELVQGPKVSPYIKKKVGVKSQGPDCEIESISLQGTIGNFIEGKLLGYDGDIKSIPLAGKRGDFVEANLQDNGDEIEIGNFKSKKKRRAKDLKKIALIDVRKVSPYFQKGIEKKDDVKLQDYDSDIKSIALSGTEGNFLEDNLQEKGDQIEIGNIKSKKRKSKDKKTIALSDVRKVSPYFQKGIEKKDNVQPQDYDSDKSIALAGTGGNFIEDNLQAKGDQTEIVNIISKKRKTKGKKNIALSDVRKVSPYFQKDIEKGNNVKPHLNDCDINSIALPSTRGNFIEDNLQENGDKVECGNVKSKKKRKPKDQKTLTQCDIRKGSSNFQNEIGKKTNIKALDNENITGKVKSKKHKKTEIPKTTACVEVQTLSPFFQNDNEKVALKQHGQESDIDAIEDALQASGNEIETVTVKSKKIKSENQRTVAHDAVQKAKNDPKSMKLKRSRTYIKSCSASLKVSPYFQKVPKIEENADDLLENESSCSKKPKIIKTTLSTSEKWDEAYKRRTPDNTWKPPRSQFGLLQEDHVHDPWRVLVICMLLNRTTGLQFLIFSRASELSCHGASFLVLFLYCLLVSLKHDLVLQFFFSSLDSNIQGKQTRVTLLMGGFGKSVTVGGRVISNLFNLCPDAEACTQVAAVDIEDTIKSLGLQRKRAIMLQRFSREYLDQSWTHVTQLHGVGKMSEAGQENVLFEIEIQSLQPNEEGGSEEHSSGSEGDDEYGESNSDSSNEEDNDLCYRLLDDIGDGPNGCGWSFISDRQKGLVPAIAEMSTTMQEFTCNMNKLKEFIKKAWEFLSRIPPKQWTRAAFDTYSKSQVYTTNMCEQFNSKIVQARGVRDKLEDHKRNSRFWVLSGLGMQRGVGPLWNSCAHAIAALGWRNLKPEDYVHSNSTKETYEKIYESYIQPVNGQNLWQHNTSEEIQPPPIKKKRGRPKTQRKKDASEKEKTAKTIKLKKRLIPTCRNCGGTGHNKRSCHTRGGSEPTNESGLETQERSSIMLPFHIVETQESIAN